MPSAPGARPVPSPLNLNDDREACARMLPGTGGAQWTECRWLDGPGEKMVFFSTRTHED